MPFNWAALVVMIAAVGTSGYYRRQARVGSETIARRREGGPVVAGRLVMSLLLFGPVLAYAVAPSWMTWASFALPEWARWLGLVVGLLAIPMVSWVLGSLGSNVSETVLTKEHHQLVSAGPYRWIRHPLYTTGIGLFLALGLMLASWFVLSVAVLVLLGIRLVVIPAEERRLVAKFADRYREYMRRTGAMWPRVRGPLLLAAAVASAGLTGCTTAPTPATVAHPLDALTPDEIRTAASVAKTDPRVAPALFASIALNDPPKADVLAWQPGRSIARQARVVAMASTTVFEVVVDLGARRLVSVVERHGVEPSVMTSEFEVPRIVLSNAEFVSALEKRGITDTAKLFCTPMTAGYFGIAPHEGRRPVKVTCFDTRRSTTNVRGWPIERLYAIVDLRTREVLSVTDGGVVPIADVDQNFTEAAVGDLRAARKPTVLAQPQGGNFTAAGQDVTWGNWRFHARVDPRVGTVISAARWQDKTGARAVLYQGYLSEMFVPYMDADYGWYSRTYFDTGEYGAGVLSSPLKAGVDCPTTAVFQPAVFADDKGEPIKTPNALCIFERSGGDPIWRHFEGANRAYEGRENVELVVRMAAVIGNYDYLLDWVFNDAAEIEVRLGATGIDALKGVASRRMTDATAAADTRYGTLVAPNLVAVNHDHYFNFRLDLDVDGTTNSFNHDVYRPMMLPADSPRRSLYVVEPRIPTSERAAQLDTGHGPAKLRVINETRTNHVGNPVSYEGALRQSRAAAARSERLADEARGLSQARSVGHAVRPVRALCRGRLHLREPRRRRPGGVGRPRPSDPQPGHRHLDQSGDAPPDAGRGSPGNASHLAFLQASAAQLLRSQPGDRPAELTVRHRSGLRPGGPHALDWDRRVRIPVRRTA